MSEELDLGELSLKRKKGGRDVAFFAVLTVQDTRFPIHKMDCHPSGVNTLCMQTVLMPPSVSTLSLTDSIATTTSRAASRNFPTTTIICPRFIKKDNRSPLFELPTECDKVCNNNSNHLPCHNTVWQL